MIKKEIYIIRHGETAYNRDKIVQGSGVDSSLNENGIAQAKMFHQKYEQEAFKMILVSDLKRTYETALPFINSGIPFLKEADLNEVSWGIFEGKPANKEMHLEYKRLNDSWKNGDYSARLEGGESAEEMQSRLGKAINKIKQIPQNKVLVVSHGRAMRCLVCMMNGREIMHMNAYDHHNTGLYKFDLIDGNFNMVLANDISHLEN